RHHALDVRALRDAVTVAAMGAGHPVGIREVGADADCDGFLADIRMYGAIDLARGAQLDRELVEFADEDHRAQHRDEIGRFVSHARPPSDETASAAASPFAAGAARS